MTIWRQIARAVEDLKQDMPVGMPTETVYGLAAPINQPRAIARIFEFKQRPFFDPLIVHVAEIDQIKEVAADLPQLARFLGERFWPGPFTVVMQRRPEISTMITSGLDTVAIRIPRHPVARRLIRRVGAPLAAPSANKFGKTSPTTAAHVRSEFAAEQVYVIDGGDCEVGIESTVVEVTEADTARIRIFRPGMISAEDIRNAVAHYHRPVEIERVDSAQSPGHLPEHYRPAIPLVIIGGELPDPVEGEAIRRRFNLEDASFAELILKPIAAIAARELYASLRSLAHSGVSFIVVRRTAENTASTWDAIWDRLNRASSADLSPR